MKRTRAVWIVDCSVIVEYINSMLLQLTELYPWLGDGLDIDTTWNWRNFQLGRKSRKNQFIDWVLCSLLIKHHYMDVVNANDNYDLMYQELFELINTSDLEEIFFNSLPIPIASSEEPLAYVVNRSCGSLFIEFQYEAGARFFFPSP